MGDDRDLPTMSIGIAAGLARLSARRIRYYQRAGLLPTRRSPGNRRLFTGQDVERLKRIRELVTRGHTLRAIAGELGARPLAGSDGALPPATEPVPGGPVTGQPVSPEVMSQRLAGRGAISSLYPVRDQALLVGMLTAAGPPAEPQPDREKTQGGKTHGVADPKRSPGHVPETQR